jgi:hypothetical protein
MSRAGRKSALETQKHRAGTQNIRFSTSFLDANHPYSMKKIDITKKTAGLKSGA